MYIIICKLHKVNNEVVCNEIGYVTSIEDAETVENINKSSFDTWITTNKDDLNNSVKDLIDYFDAGQIVYFADSKLTNFDNFSLNLILNPNSPE